MRPGESLESLSREQLLELLSIYSKNWQAMDGVWFQSVEGKYGMEEAMYHDVEAWKRFTVTEARRIKKFLNLPEYPGLEGLEQALQFRFYANLSHYQLIRQGDTLLYRVLECRVQQARTRKNLGLHPCKPAGLAEYAGFAKTIDGRITCQCLSCCPEVTDPGCACAWLFRLKGENSPAATGEFAGLSGKHGENFRQTRIKFDFHCFAQIYSWGTFLESLQKQHTSLGMPPEFFPVGRPIFCGGFDNPLLEWYHGAPVGQAGINAGHVP